MNTIDFLPERYRQATTRRRTSYWRLVVTLLFVGVFAATAVGLHITHRGVHDQVASVNARFAVAQSQLAAVAEARARSAALDDYAAMITFLRHPWPRSRVVAALLDPLPAGMAIHKIRIHEVERPKPTTSEATTTSESTEAVAPSVHTDLAELRKHAEAVDVVVHLEGTTRDVPTLHRYLQQLASDDFFIAAEPTTIEAAVGANDAATVAGEDPSARPVATSRFAAAVTVRPSWGISGGPTLDGAKSTPLLEQARIGSARVADRGER